MTPKMTLSLKDQVVLDDIVLASNFTTKLLGYMFQKKPKSKGILFQHCHALHSYFMHFDLDLYFLDQDYQLVHMVQSFKPNRTINIPKAFHVLEMPSNTLSVQAITTGQSFLFRPQDSQVMPDDK